MLVDGYHLLMYMDGMKTFKCIQSWISTDWMPVFADVSFEVCRLSVCRPGGAGFPICSCTFDDETIAFLWLEFGVLH